MDSFLTNPNDIVNQFINFFLLVAPTIQSIIKPNFKYFDHYLTEACKESFQKNISTAHALALLEILKKQ